MGGIFIFAAIAIVSVTPAIPNPAAEAAARFRKMRRSEFWRKFRSLFTVMYQA
jgi:hypothetical protein